MHPGDWFGKVLTWNLFLPSVERYLKDRKGRQMDDPVHYCKMATAIAKTIELQNEIESIFKISRKRLLNKYKPSFLIHIKNRLTHPHEKNPSFFNF